MYSNVYVLVMCLVYNTEDDEERAIAKQPLPEALPPSTIIFITGSTITPRFAFQRILKETNGR